jgi:YVTN family beta-propeller protein
VLTRRALLDLLLAPIVATSLPAIAIAKTTPRRKRPRHVNGPNVTALVVCAGSNEVVFVNMVTALVTHRVTVGKSPSRIIVDASGSRAYVANFDASSISIIDVASASLVGAIATGNGPAAMALDPVRKLLYVCNIIDGTLSTIDLASNTTIGTAKVGTHPNWIAIDTDGKTGYVANSGDTTLSRLFIMPTGHITVKPLEIQESTTAMFLSPSKPDTAYLIADRAGQLLVFDRIAGKIVKRIDGFSQPIALQFDAVGTHAYVAETGADRIAVVDLQGDAISAHFAVGSQPYALVADRTRRYLLTANYGDNSLSVIDVTRGTISRISGFNQPIDVATVG